jgi:hypothetical protein
MTYTHGTLQALHVMLAKNVPHQALALALTEFTAAAGHDAGGILPTVLKYRQGIIDVRGDIILGN